MRRSIHGQNMSKKWNSQVSLQSEQKLISVSHLSLVCPLMEQLNLNTPSE